MAKIEYIIVKIICGYNNLVKHRNIKVLEAIKVQNPCVGDVGGM